MAKDKEDVGFNEALRRIANAPIAKIPPTPKEPKTKKAKAPARKR